MKKLSFKLFLCLIISTLAHANLEQNVTQVSSRFESLAKLTKILATVEQYYVDDIEFNKIIDKSIDGLLNNLDAHSDFLDAKKYKDLKIQTDGEFGGLGITVGMRDETLNIIAPIEGTPADKAGLKAGDIILRIDGKSTLNMTIDEAVKLMRGKPKTSITLTIIRKKERKPLEFKIQRDIIKIQSVYSKNIESENVLYLRVTNFDKHVADSVKKILKEDKNSKGIVLDLRNNPGGLLIQAVALADLFVDEGVIVSQKGRLKEEDDKENTHKASRFTTIYKKPMVILINGGSASASEIVAGALQDFKRAILVGEKSFGKGSVQVILPVNKEEALRLTVARYYLPSGRTIQAVGITPDVITHEGKVLSDENDDFSLKESDLKQHLVEELNKLGDNAKNKQNKENNDTKNIITKEQILKDNQLKTALDVLKVLIITDKK